MAWFQACTLFSTERMNWPTFNTSAEEEPALQHFWLPWYECFHHGWFRAAEHDCVEMRLARKKHKLACYGTCCARECVQVSHLHDTSMHLNIHYLEDGAQWSVGYSELLFHRHWLLFKCNIYWWFISPRHWAKYFTRFKLIPAITL